MSTNRNINFLAGYIPVKNIEKLKKMNLKVGDIVSLAGYYTQDDGATHKRVISNEDDGSGVLLNNGLYANIVHNGEVNVEWFGAKGNGVDDSDIFLKALSYNFTKITIPNKMYEIKKMIKFNNRDNITIDFYGKIHFPSQDKITYLFLFENCFNVTINNFDFYSENDKEYIHPTLGVRLLSSNVRPMSFNNCHDIIIKNPSFINSAQDLQIRGDIPQIVDGNKIYKSYNFKIYNWYSRGSHGNIFSDNTKDFYIEKPDFELIELEKLKGRAHNIYFAQNTLNVIIKDFKARYLDDHLGSTFHFTNGGLSELDNSSSPHNIIIINADVVATSNVFTGMLNADIRVYNSKFTVDKRYINIRKSVTLCNIYDDTEMTFSNCSIEGFKTLVSGESDKNPTTVFDTCKLRDIGYSFWLQRKIGNVSILNSTFSGKQIYNGGVDGTDSSAKKIIIANNIINITSPIQMLANMDLIIDKNIINLNNTTQEYIFQNANKTVKGAKVFSNIINAQANKMFNFPANTYPQYVPEFNGNIINGQFDKLELISDTKFTKLDNSVYYQEKMKQEGVYDDFIYYMDEKTLYDKQQEKLEMDKQLAYREELKTDPTLTYEKFISNETEVDRMMLPNFEEPKPSQKLQAFIDKWL